MRRKPWLKWAWRQVRRKSDENEQDVQEIKKETKGKRVNNMQKKQQKSKGGNNRISKVKSCKKGRKKTNYGKSGNNRPN